MQKELIKIGVIDDNQANIESLINSLNEFEFNYQLAGIAHNLKEGERLILTKEIDLLFLDMKLPDGEGVDLLGKLNNKRFKTIFFTAHKDYALSAFEFGSVDYILKPIQLEDVSRAMSKYYNLYFSRPTKNNKKEVLSIPHKEGVLYIERDKVLYFKAYGEYCYLVTEDKKEFVSRTLKEIEEIIGDHTFIRTHRSFLVNSSKVSYYNQKGMNYLILTNSEEIPISRRKKEIVAELMIK